MLCYDISCYVNVALFSFSPSLFNLLNGFRLTSSPLPSLYFTCSTIRWHLSQSDVDDVAVYIPMTQINDNGGNFISILRAIPRKEVQRKQAAIRRIGRWWKMYDVRKQKFIIFYTILYYTILYYTILYYTTLYYTTLHRTHTHIRKYRTSPFNS